MKHYQNRKLINLGEGESHQSQFLGDSNFPRSSLNYYEKQRVQLVQGLYETYSALNLTHPNDRHRAIKGLEQRLARTLKSWAYCGLLRDFFKRMILWQAEIPGQLYRIVYQGNNIPSWSWMASEGRIRYMEIPFDGVKWTRNLKCHFGSASIDNNWNGRLAAKASRLLLDEAECGRRAILDSCIDQFSSATWKCVVVGKSRDLDEAGERSHYALLIRPASAEESTMYERVGSGIFFASHFSAETERVYIR